MFTSRTLTGSTVWEQLNPAFRMVDFSDSPAVITVSHYLRLAWSFVPDTTYSCDEVGIGQFMRETQARTLAEAQVQAEAQTQTSTSKADDDDTLATGEEVPLVLNEVEGECEDETADEDGKVDDGELVSIAPRIETIATPEPTGENQDSSEDERTQQQISESQTHSEWQLAILAFWNHVFWDVMQFLPHVGMGIGHFHVPSHSSLSIPFPSASPPAPLPRPRTSSSPSNAPKPTIALDSKTDGQTPLPVLKHTFPTNTLLIPTYLAPGVTLRMTTGEDAPDQSTEELLGTFSHETKTECWWLRQGVEVSIYIDHSASPSPSSPISTLSPADLLSPAYDNTNGKEAVAAVLVIGILCDAMHEEAIEAIEAEELRQEILEAEMEIPVDGPVLEVY